MERGSFPTSLAFNIYVCVCVCVCEFRLNTFGRQLDRPRTVLNTPTNQQISNIKFRENVPSGIQIVHADGQT
jgi:hypothetical protein